MTWLALAWLCGGYYHFRGTLRHCQAYDSPGTVLLNAALALLVGPALLILASPFILAHAIERRL